MAAELPGDDALGSARVGGQRAGAYQGVAREHALILVVEPEPEDAARLFESLAAAGYLVMLAPSGEEALAIVENATPDLIVLDLLLPGLDGIETCSRMRARPELLHVPFVFMTAASDATLLVESSAEADDLLVKPVPGATLMLRVRSLLRIKRANAELRRRNHELVRRRERRDELVEFMVHDLKNQLSVIAVGAECLEHFNSMPDEDRRVLSKLRLTSDGIGRMLGNLEDVIRTGDGNLRLRLESVDLHALVASVCDTMQPMAHAQGRVLAAEVPGELKPIRMDPEVLQRVLGNLLANAIRYSPAGGCVRLEVQERPSKVVELRIADQGPGIPFDQRESIFDKYVRLDPESPPGKDHSGLGLTFARMAVEAHGGTIWVEPNEPRGSVFCVHLRADGPPAAPEAPR